MSSVTRRWWLLGAATLAITSVATLALLVSGEVIPSLVRDPLLDFVLPGVTVWWLVLGGPFRAAPSSLPGIAFAGVANAVLWLLVLWFAMAITRAVRRLLAAPPS